VDPFLADPTDPPAPPAAQAPRQATFVLNEREEDPSFILGPRPGPYLEERSRSVFCKLGARIGFIGIDARTERTRHQINTLETYARLFDRLNQEYKNDSNLRHLIVLLGVPIVYPRLLWAENLIAGGMFAPLRAINRRWGFADGLFNKFDGQVDLLDDLDDHYTNRHHKTERRELIERFQRFARAYSVRVTILGGDVHLAAIGRFYSRPDLALPARSDWRYMVNIISSAITNKPPPDALANFIARRDKAHRVNETTDERMLNFFDHDPGRGKEAVEEHHRAGRLKFLPRRRTAKRNHITMPSRNYAVVTESGPVAGRPSSSGTPADLGHAVVTEGGPVAGRPSSSGSGEITPAPVDPKLNAAAAEEDAKMAAALPAVMPAFSGRAHNTRLPMTDGEMGCGSGHPAADGVTPSGRGGECGLDVTIRVEIDSADMTGMTYGYGMTVPELDTAAVVKNNTPA
jgi:hypothetical protein